MRVSGLVLATRGTVMPVTTGNVVLVCGSGEKICMGEHAIASSPMNERKTLRLEPVAYANPKAVVTIEAADCIVIGKSFSEHPAELASEGGRRGNRPVEGDGRV